MNRSAWRKRIRAIVRRVRVLTLFADARSIIRFARLRAQASGDEGVPLRLRPLGGSHVHVRPGTADVWAIGDTLLPPVHLPPEELCQDRPLRAVLDLGANIGLSMAHIAVLHPGARIVGVELDRDNARMAALNVASWDDRCEVLHGAAWHEDGTVQYSRQLGREMALAAAADEGDESAPAFSVAKLIERAAVDGRVDYMKMDIEGAEADVLRHGEAWAHRVRGISVEVHEPYTLDDCQSALESLGFQTRSDHRGTDATGGKPVVVGIRPPA